MQHAACQKVAVSQLLDQVLGHLTLLAPQVAGFVVSSAERSQVAVGVVLRRATCDMRRTVKLYWAARNLVLVGNTWPCS
jgi:hypothetical protein